MTDGDGGGRFIIIGENIHCSRVVKREGARGGLTPDGRPAVRFPAPDGGDAFIPLPASITDSSEFRVSERIKHVMQAAFAGRRLVVFSGGEAKGTEGLLEEVRQIRDGGGHGSIIGRNSFQRPKDQALELLDQVVKIYLGQA